MTEKIAKTQEVSSEASGAGLKRFVLRLFVTGILPNSTHAVINIKAICENYLKDNYELEILEK